MRQADVQSFVSAGLTGLGYTDLPMFHPGPWASTQLQNLTPGRLVFLQLGNGAGLSVEHVFDRPFITVRVIGPQNDYVGAERLAYDIDNILLGVGSPTKMGTARVLYVTRSGGGPALIDFDSAERYHFQTTYVTETPTG